MYTKYDVKQRNVYPLPVTRTNRERNIYHADYTSVSTHGTAEYSRLLRYHIRLYIDILLCFDPLGVFYCIM